MKKKCEKTSYKGLKPEHLILLRVVGIDVCVNEYKLIKKNICIDILSYIV